jgi:tetratricopeptide (TPR) repeat protein
LAPWPSPPPANRALEKLLSPGLGAFLEFFLEQKQATIYFCLALAIIGSTMYRTRCLKILAFMLVALGLGAGGLSGQGVHLKEADSLMQSPKLDFHQARRALDLYEAILPLNSDERGPLLTRLARGCFILGDLAGASQRRKYYDKGRGYAEMLCREEPAGVAGPYWLALNLCGLAEVQRGLQAFKLLPRIIRKLERIVAVDPAYDQAGACRVLGRIYYEAPAWPLSVGNLKKSLQHLMAAVRLAPENSTNHLYLAETLLRLERTSQACQELERVFRATRHAVWPQGLEDDRREARRLLKECATCGSPAEKSGAPPQGG